MKKTISIILSIVMVFAMTITCFAENAVKITATVPEASYTVNIPSAVSIDKDNYGFAVIGSASVKDIVHVSSSKTISYVATGTDFSDGNGKTIPAKYYTTTQTSPTKDTSAEVNNKVTGSISVFSGGAAVVTPTKICVGIEADDWLNAAAGTYTATLTYEFSVQ